MINIAKLFTMFLILIAIQAVIILYNGQTVASTDLWTFVMGFAIVSWSNLGWILTMGAIASAIFFSGISGGNVFGFKTDFIIMAPAIAGLISIGVVFSNLAGLIRNFLISSIFTACPANNLHLICPPTDFLIAITLGPIAFYYVWTVAEWWRGKDF